MQAFVCDRCGVTVTLPNAMGKVTGWKDLSNTFGVANAAYDISRDLCANCYCEFKNWIAHAPAKEAESAYAASKRAEQ